MVKILLRSRTDWSHGAYLLLKTRNIYGIASMDFLISFIFLFESNLMRKSVELTEVA